MRRVCFVGSSHVAAVKLGLDLARDAGLLHGIVADTFATHKASLASCAVEGGTVRPTSEGVAQRFAWTSGGRTEIALDGYDDIFVVAGESPFSLSRYVPHRMLPPPSPALYRAVAEEWRGEWAPRFAAAVAREAGHAAVHFVGQPEISSGSPRAKTFVALLAGDEARLAVLRDIQAEVAAAVRGVPHGLASAVTFPPACLDEWGVFTDHAFCRGSVRLVEGFGEEHADTDFHHMNAAYGLELLRHLGLCGPAA